MDNKRTGAIGQPHIFFIAKATKLARNSPQSDSLKTTIPKEIIQVLKVKVGDEVVWSLAPDPVIKDGVLAIAQPKEQFLKKQELLLQFGSIPTSDFKAKT